MTTSIASSIYPPYGAPYYIVAPPYRRYSGGVKVLHFLCNALNKAGQKAYIVLSENAVPGVSPLHPRLLTPVLSNEENGFYRSEGIEPIVIYPEIIRDNPLGAKHVVRYLLHFAGAFGGPKRYPDSDMVISYYEEIQRDYGRGDVLTLPVVDPAIFHPPATPTERKGSCFYAYKYKLKGGQLLDITKGSTEITKDYPVSVAELADMLRKAEIFYAYEDTALVLEAALCGCPSVQLFGKGNVDGFGTDAVAYSLEPSEVARAKATVHKVWESYQNILNRFEEQLKEFIEKTQHWNV